MNKQVCLFASAIAVGLVAIAGKPAAADTCLTQPNLRADGGRWYYRVDRPTHRKCWYQQTPRTEARSTTSSRPSPAKSNSLSSWLPSFSTALTRKTPDVGVQEEAHGPRSAEPALERSSRWRLRAARRGDADRAHNRRANEEQLRATQVEPDNSRVLHAEPDSRRQEVDPAVLRAAREDQDSLRVQSNGSNDARARAIEPEGWRTRRGINPDNGRGAQVDPEDPQLNLIDLNGVHARNATSFTKGDRLQPKAGPTVAAPPSPQASPQVSIPVQVKAGVSLLDAAQREALFQEFLRTQERQWVRFW
jgi:hypothetical protein